MTRLPFAACVVAASLASACDSDPPCGLRTCDIRDADCQRMAANAAACIRGVKPVVVPVAVVSRDAFIAAAAAATATPDEEEAFRRWNAGLAALNLAPLDNSTSTANAASAARIGGAYSPTDQQITIVDDGTPLAGIGWVKLLVHENVHAIQDKLFVLDALSAQHATDLDRALAFGSVFEGEATYVEDVTEAGFFATAPGDVAWNDVFEKWQRNAREAARTSPLPVTLSWLHFRYPFGTGFVKGVLDERSWTGIDALFAAPPSGTREVIAGFGAREPGGGPWAIDLGDDAVPVLGDDYDYVGTDRMGAWLFDVFLTRLNGPYGKRELPAFLRGDALSIFFDRYSAGVVAVWRLRLAYGWSSSGELSYAVSELPAARAEPADNDLVVIAASDTFTLHRVPSEPPYQAIPAARTAGAPVWRPNWTCALATR